MVIENIDFVKLRLIFIIIKNFLQEIVSDSQYTICVVGKKRPHENQRV
jgi:hypothetical protein